MSKFRDLIIEIQDEIERGELSYRQIAISYNISYADVLAIAEEMERQYAYEDAV